MSDPIDTRPCVCWLKDGSKVRRLCDQNGDYAYSVTQTNGELVSAERELARGTYQCLECPRTLFCLSHVESGFK